jgi:cell division protein FtsQ
MKLFLKILLIVLWLGLAAGAIVLMSFANQNHETKACTGIEVKLDYAGSEPLFTVGDIKQKLVATFGKLENKKLYQLNLEKIQSYLNKNPYIDYADVHVTVEGKLVVELSQCKPIIRLISLNGQNFFLDEKGKLIPVNPDYPVRVLVASGNIEVPILPGKSIFDKRKKKSGQENAMKVLTNIYSLAKEMKKDSVMNALVEQIYINPDGTVKLATKAGSHLIEFGDTTDAFEKIENLKAFYKYGLTKTGWQKYRIINLTYKNQVVCTK